MKAHLPSELLHYQQATTDIFAAGDDVCLAVLYGSQTRGQAGPLSDIE